MQRVVELTTEPVVGKFYLVPCALSDGEWIPTLGPQHEDKKIIGFPALHYHIDVRFVPQRMVDRNFARLCDTGYIITCTPAENQMSRVLIGIAEVREMKRKCLRPMSNMPLQRSTLGRPDWQVKLEKKYRKVSAKCGRCPHKGFNLKDLPVKDGKVVCPGHGLMWDVETGKLVKRI